ncbi:hypothetical protein DJ68_06370, partial [Halorubrum sp. C3]
MLFLFGTHFDFNELVSVSRGLLCRFCEGVCLVFSSVDVAIECNVEPLLVKVCGRESDAKVMLWTFITELTAFVWGEGFPVGEEFAFLCWDVVDFVLAEGNLLDELLIFKITCSVERR